MKVLQLTSHMGAGAGKAISGVSMADMDNTHEIVLLDRPEKTDHLERCEDQGIRVIICPSRQQLLELSASSDVIIVNWWHHPLLYQALMDISELPTRLVLWSHVNGIDYPRLKFEFASCFDACMFTSSLSFHNPNWTNDEQDIIGKKSELVYGIGNFDPQSLIPKSSYEAGQEIKVGYAGSLDYAKVHPDFVQWVKNATERNDHLCFELAGDITRAMEQDVRQSKLSEKIRFLGFRTDIEKIMLTWDIFIYLLNPSNFATTENALLESMAIGLPIIATDGSVEKSIVKDSETGLLASDPDEFVEKLNQLSADAKQRTILGENARAYTIRQYNAKSNFAKFISIINSLLRKSKRVHDFRSAVGADPYEWFLSGCGAEDAAALNALSEFNHEQAIASVRTLSCIYKGKSKGSVEQFRRYFPNDRRIAGLAKIIHDAQGGELS